MLGKLDEEYDDSQKEYWYKIHQKEQNGKNKEQVGRIVWEQFMGVIELIADDGS